MTLYRDIIDSGIEMDSRESDLYFKASDQTRKILAKYPICEKIAVPFTNEITKELWIDVPFAYDPFWERKQRIAEALAR
jgi:hypothetical protein